MYDTLLRQSFLVPFTICSVASLLVLWYLRVRNPIRQFRPPFGQLLLIGVILFMASGAVSLFVAKTILGGADVAEDLKRVQFDKYFDREGGDAILSEGRKRGFDGDLDGAKGMNAEEQARLEAAREAAAREARE